MTQNDNKFGNSHPDGSSKPRFEMIEMAWEFDVGFNPPPFTWWSRKNGCLLRAYPNQPTTNKGTLSFRILVTHDIPQNQPVTSSPTIFAGETFMFPFFPMMLATSFRSPIPGPASHPTIDPGDVEVTVLGCATERKLRIFSMAGDCILERTHQELKAYNRVPGLGWCKGPNGMFVGFMDLTSRYDTWWNMIKLCNHKLNTVRWFSGLRLLITP